MSFSNHTNEEDRFYPVTGAHASDKLQVDAIEIGDREVFIKQVFKTDPSKGCELLFKRYYGPLCSHAVKYVYSKEKAEDMVADVFYKFWENKYYEQVCGSYRSYLFRAVRNTALNLVKKEFGRPEADMEDCEEKAPATHDTAQLLEAEELSRLIEKTIRELPPKCQRVFLMSRLESKKNMEIARQLKVSLKAVEAHISKALGILRLAVQELNG